MKTSSLTDDGNSILQLIHLNSFQISLNSSLGILEQIIIWNPIGSWVHEPELEPLC